MKTINDIPPYLNLSLEDMDGEIWKDVIGTNGAYSVSNLGRVRSNERTAISKSRHGNVFTRPVYACICKQHIVQTYLKVHLSFLDGKKRMVNVHKLVAEAFIPNPNSFLCINHKSEIKTENFVENLEWCSHKYNNNYGTRNKRISDKQINDPKKSKRIAQLDMQGNLVREWDSICEAGRAGYDRKGISGCCRNKPTFNTSGGYKWKFI